jgi:hypothetical protein
MLEQPDDKAPEQPAPQPSAAPSSEPSLESFLQEFEAQTRPKEQPAPTEQPQQQEPDIASALAELDRSIKNSDDDPWALFDGEALKKQVAHLGGLFQQMAVRERFRVDSAEFESLVSKADAMVRDLGKAVDDDYVRRYLMAESLATPGIKEAFDSRHDSAEHLRQWQRAEKKMLSRLAADAKKIPDQELTADRLAVVQSMRGGGHPPAEKPVDVANMPESDFRAMLRNKWGL